jgi:hypothetical protein
MVGFAAYSGGVAGSAVPEKMAMVPPLRHRE